MISIGQLMDASDIVAEIRMERQASPSAFILMEGTTDIRRFEQFIDNNITSTVNCWGKEKLLSAVKSLNESNFSGFLALADADFDRIIGDIEYIENIIYSEGHDFDIDSFRTSVFIRYITEVGDETKCKSHGETHDILEKIAIGIRPLSGAKLANRKNRIQIQFSEINWCPAFDGMSFNREQLAFLVLKKGAPDRSAIENFLKVVSEEESNDLWQVTNGHDFSCALGISLRTQIGSRKWPQTTSEEIERHIRLALCESDFKEMKIFECILEWQRESGYRILNQNLL